MRFLLLLGFLVVMGGSALSKEPRGTTIVEFYGPHPIDPGWARQLREEREWLSHPENLDTYAGQVIAVYNGEVWGHGPDHQIALGAVRARIDRHADEPGLPALRDMNIIILDDWRVPEPPWSDEM